MTIMRLLRKLLNIIVDGLVAGQHARYGIAVKLKEVKRR